MEKSKPQQDLNAAVLYALKCGCFFPVPPLTSGMTDECIRWN